MFYFSSIFNSGISFGQYYPRSKKIFHRILRCPLCVQIMQVVHTSTFNDRFPLSIHFVVSIYWRSKINCSTRRYPTLLMLLFMFLSSRQLSLTDIRTCLLSNFLHLHLAISFCNRTVAKDPGYFLLFFRILSHFLSELVSKKKTVRTRLILLHA